MRIRLQVFDSRVARRIFALFLVGSLVPLFVLAVWLSQRVGGEVERHAEEQLAAAARGYGRMTLEKLLAISAVVRGAEAQRANPALKELKAAAVVRDGTPEILFGDWPISPTSVAVDASKPTVTLARSADGYDIIVAHADADGAVLARLDASYLWQTKDVLARGMEVCVFGPLAVSAPIHCSSPLPAETQAQLQSARQRAASGRLSWSSAGDVWLTAYWELFLPSRFAGEP